MGAPYRDAPEAVEKLPLDEHARAHLAQAIRSATRRSIVCVVVLALFALGLYGSRGVLLVVFPLDFLALGLAIELRLELRHLLRARADHRGGLERVEGEQRWRGVAYQLVLDDGRVFWHTGVLGRWRAVVLPRLGEVLHAELIAEAGADDARAAQDEAMATLLRTTEETWASNAAGRLTSAQRLRLLRRAWWPLVVTGFYVIWFASAGLHWQSLLFGFPVVIFAGLSALWIAAALGGRARTLEGPVTAERRGGKYPSYSLRVGDERIDCDVLVHTAFRLTGRRHRVIACTIDPRVLAVRAID